MISLKDFVSNFFEGVRSTVSMHRHAADLSRMSDRELSDIGLSRTEVHLDDKRYYGA